jgi:hypothetical protein
MNLHTQNYLDQHARWPRTGRHILAQYDAESIVVYQAYAPSIGGFAATHGWFGGDFKYSRMSWIKPNFLWMMYRSGWGTKPSQEVTLAVRIRREAFDLMLDLAVYSSFVPAIHPDHDTWKEQVERSLVRLQWDPDHDPAGNKLERRAIQLGLRGDVLAKYGREWIVGIEDISDFVREERGHLADGPPFERLVTPREEVYPVPPSSFSKVIGEDR